MLRAIIIEYLLNKDARNFIEEYLRNFLHYKVHLLYYLHYGGFILYKESLKNDPIQDILFYN